MFSATTPVAAIGSPFGEQSSLSVGVVSATVVEQLIIDFVQRLSGSGTLVGSFEATRAFGLFRSLYDTVYNMNLQHLSRAHKTVFEHLDDAGLRELGLGLRLDPEDPVGPLLGWNTWLSHYPMPHDPRDATYRL